MGRVKFKSSAKSSRELRRIAEREQGREKRRQAIDAFWRLSPEERARRIADNEAFQRISKNGITIEDMHRAEEEAYVKGVKDGKDGAVRTCFAAMCLTLHDMHGFGNERCARVLNDVYDRLQFTLTSQEAIQQVYDTMGLQIRFSGDVTEDAVTEVPSSV